MNLFAMGAGMQTPPMDDTAVRDGYLTTFKCAWGDFMSKAGPDRSDHGGDWMEYDEYIVDLNADCKCGCRDLHRFHNIYHFPNDLGASVIANPKQEGFADAGYRVMIIRFDDAETYSPETPEGYDGYVIESDSWDDVVRILDDLRSRN